ncbi:YebC/PmpR family DNA-binding transcriptional regulator [Candidatus Shapirobacteria bacterium CG10_big_fil_rev_8_21_14_0_10_40_9]|uniref:Probable transcriptional regulatory protein COU95_02090 n=1 Tax=Candidatus Shapirobacteria bacterium CG10_big_fil_rev_8_21_14_0_10_40_9 TaxID=1974888 RepID=A0A2M8L3K9_9BACT|nr:MAG: YebC/PmpR family DNA-binding transcriptional regulator [Candidatus Shapirobacteria bacterium CG10_big_fil_rev_8_21_14_0_10_40_9]
MSGHSKWATIHRQKETTDAKKGLAWTKVANAIIVAVRQTGITDPEKNFKLRLAIEKGRALNMPKENIERAIFRGGGEAGKGKIEEVTYEGFGPEGIAIVCETATDNKQRTAQEIKNIFERGGGKLVGPGSVSFLFEKTALITLEKPQNPQESILSIIDLGAEDVEEVADAIEVYTKVENLEEMKKKLTEAGFKISNFEITMKPKTTVPISDKETAQKVLDFLEKIEEQPDVQKVFANFDIPVELVNQLTS